VVNFVVLPLRPLGTSLFQRGGKVGGEVSV